MAIRATLFLIAFTLLTSACASGKAVNNALGEPTHMNTSTEPQGNQGKAPPKKK
jgi:hypothetical protein